MKVYTLAEIGKELKAQDYNHVALFDSNTERVMGYNAATKMNEHFEKIKTRLKSDALPDGIYIIKCKYGTKSKADNFPIQKGMTIPVNVPLAEPKPPQKEPTAIDEPASYAELIVVRERNAELQIENKYLKQQLEENNEALAELGEDLEEKSLAADNTTAAKDIFATLTESFTPIIDKFLEQRDRRLKIDETQLIINNPHLFDQNGQQPQPAQPTPQVQQSVPNENGNIEVEPPQELSEEDQRLFWQEMSALAVTDPDEYFAVMQKLQMPYER